MLNENEIDFRYRDYRGQPLTATEIRSVLSKLGSVPREVLRRRDKAFRELGLTGNESDDVLIEHMARHPTLLERPIGILGSKAAVGRPPEKLLSLFE